MKKKYIIMMISIFVIGIITGVLTTGLYFSKKAPKLFISPSMDYYQQKAIRLLDLDKTQFKQFEVPINKFSERAYLIEKESNLRMYNTLDSLYIELKPNLSDKQKENLEKRLNRINLKIIKQENQ